MRRPLVSSRRPSLLALLLVLLGAVAAPSAQADAGGACTGGGSRAGLCVFTAGTSTSPQGGSGAAGKTASASTMTCTAGGSEIPCSKDGASRPDARLRSATVKAMEPEPQPSAVRKGTPTRTPRGGAGLLTDGQRGRQGVVPASSGLPVLKHDGEDVTHTVLVEHGALLVGEGHGRGRRLLPRSSAVVRAGGRGVAFVGDGLVRRAEDEAGEHVDAETTDEVGSALPDARTPALVEQGLAASGEVRTAVAAGHQWREQRP